MCAFLIVTILQDSLNYLHFMEVSWHLKSSPTFRFSRNKWQRQDFQWELFTSALPWEIGINNTLWTSHGINTPFSTKLPPISEPNHDFSALEISLYFLTLAFFKAPVKSTPKCKNSFKVSRTYSPIDVLKMFWALSASLEWM